MRLSRFRPSPTMAVAVMALVVALGGTSYAAGLIGSNDIKNNSVKSKDIKNKTIKGKDVKKNTLKTGQVKDGSLLTDDFKAGQIPAGPQGPAGVGRWALINAAGQIEAQSGGFSVTAGYPVLPNTAVAPLPDNSLRANGNVYINANEPLTNNGVLATIALQNTVDQDRGRMRGRTVGPDANAEFSGEIVVSQCGLPGTACAPPGTANVNHFVVSPRLSDGQPTGLGGAADRKRFYIIITGNSTDYVAP